MRISLLLLQIFNLSVALYFLFSDKMNLGEKSITARLLFFSICVSAVLTLRLYRSFRPIRFRRKNRPGTFEREDQEMALSEKQRTDFVTSVSHELRTPLTAIQGYTELISSSLNPEARTPVQPYLEIIEKNTGRLIDLCSDLLKMGRIEHNDIHREKCSPKLITQEVLDRLNDQIIQKNHEISIRIECAEIYADERLLGQLVNNLVENAIRYVPWHGKIEIAWEKSRSGVLFSVKDNGPGIPEEHHERLFDRFYRVDKSRSRDEGGTGLGLALVKQITLRHDGKVWVESRLGEGSKFCCYFPRS